LKYLGWTGERELGREREGAWDFGQGGKVEG